MITKNTTRKQRITGLAGLLTVAALGVAGATAGMAPANAQVLDTDRPKVTERHFDFGKNWSLGAPRNGGYLYWDLTSGLTTATVEGYLYLTDQECGRVRVDFYDEDHNWLSTRSSSVECAPGNGKTQWWKSLSYSSATVTHVHVSVDEQLSWNTYQAQGTAYEDFN